MRPRPCALGFPRRTVSRLDEPYTRVSLSETQGRTVVERDSRERGSVYDVAVLQKALDLLEAIAGGPELGLRQLSLQTGASKASSFRVLTTLERRGYLIKDPVTRKYSPGPRLMALSFATVARLDVPRRARPVLEQLRAEFDETVNLGVLSDREVLYLDIVESTRGLRMSSRVGARDQLHSTALGKAYLATMTEPEIRALLDGYERRQKTRRTIVDMDQLVREIDLTRARGYSIDDEENDLGARCVGIAVTDPDGRPQAAISISGPAARIQGRMLEDIGKRLTVAAEEVAMVMGWRAQVVDSA